MKRILFLAAAVWFIQTAPAWAYVEGSFTLGRMIQRSTNIVVMKVDQVNKEKGFIIYTKVADLKGTHPDEQIKHVMISPDKRGQLSGEQQAILDWAEPGKIAISVTLKAGPSTNLGTSKPFTSFTCVGKTPGKSWYQCAHNEGSSWTHMAGMSKALEWAYVGSAEKLRDHVTAILAGQEVVVTAVEYDPYNAGRLQYNGWTTSTGWLAWDNLQLETTRHIWRIKAGLKILGFLDEIAANPGKYVVGRGAGDGEAIPALIERLQNAEAAVRCQAADDLGWIGPEAKTAVASLTQRLTDEDEKVRRAAAAALGQIGPEAKSAVSALGEVAMKDSADGVRRSALEALGRLRAVAKNGVPALTVALKDKQPPVRFAAAAALWRIGPEAKAAVSALAEALKDDDHRTRIVAAAALGSQGAEAKDAVPALVLMLDDKRHDHRQPVLSNRMAAIGALAAIGPAAMPAAPRLNSLLKDSDNNARRYAAEALGRIRPVPRGATAELFEDDVAFLAAHFRVAGPCEAKDRFSGDCSIRITGHVHQNIVGWGFPIVEKPQLGEYRYVRFAWKKVGGGSGIGIRFANFGQGGKGYFAGQGRQNMGLKNLADAAPEEWVVVTRDLFKDFGEFTVHGIGLVPLGGGEALYDHVYLGRTLEDLDKIPVKK